MSKERIVRAFFVCLLSFSLVFAPVDFASIPATLLAEESDLVIEGTQEWSGVHIVSGYASVLSDATLTIRKGSIIEFEGQAILDVAGELFVEGTPEEPVIFRKKNSDNPDEYYTIISSGKIRARNIDVSGGGSASEVFMVDNGKRSFLNRAQALWMYSGAFGAQSGGVLDIERANFHDNTLAVYTDRSSASQVKVWRSQFSGNTLDFVNNGGSSLSRLQYNWWGNENGPGACETDCGEYFPRPYQKIIGKIDFSSWAKEQYTKDPVIVIPGIMGSWKKTQTSELELDPLMGTYDNLLKTLEGNGYEEGKNLFSFPYEWRQSNVGAATLLATKINEIKAKTNWPEVDIVAHSMGGLVARQYIAQAYSNGGNVDQLITLGTPHNGSSKSYLMWEGGDFKSASRFSFVDFFAEKIFQQEAKENGYESIFDYIRKVPIASVRETLPIYGYLRENASGEMRSYPNLYPTNAFLENLKTTGNMNRLAPIAFTNIVGNTGDETITNIRVGDPSIELLSDPENIVLWGHGKPDGYDDFLGGDRGLELGTGDGTVPIDSAKDIVSDELIELASGHGNLPSDAAEIVYKTLTGVATQSSIVKKSQPASLLLVMPFSPVDIQVISPSGLRVGKDFDGGGFLNEIPGAYYTGSDTKNEFITIPNPEDGKYTILARGTDEGGTYRIETTKITEAESGETTESTATIEGEAVAGMMEEDMSVEVSADTVELIEDKDVVAPTITITSPESKTYTNSGIIPVSYDVSDDVSPEEKLTTVVSLDGEAYAKADIDLSLLALGAHTLKLTATDEAGNTGEAQADFTLETSWEALLENIDHYAALGLLKNKGERKMLENNMRRLGETAEILEKYDVFFRLHPKLRDIFEREIAHRLSILQRYVKQRSAKSIDPLAAERLMESMEALKSR